MADTPLDLCQVACTGAARRACAGSHPWGRPPGRAPPSGHRPRRCLTPMARNSAAICWGDRPPSFFCPPVIATASLIEDLVGDVHTGGERGADRLDAGMVVGAVAEILEHVIAGGKRRLADPVRALAPHMGVAERRPVHPLRHVVAADPGIGAMPLGHLGRGVVRAAGAEIGQTRGQILGIVGLAGFGQTGPPARIASVPRPSSTRISPIFSAIITGSSA
jgi:hypothetical protein